MSRIVLIDGHSILNRAFYGVPDLTNSEGIHTGAVYGFLNIMFSILEEERPEYLTVAFDVHAPTFRHEMFSEYKGTRNPMPEELRQQVPLIQDVLKAMNIQICMLPGYEADDVLGTLAKSCQSLGMEVSLVSGDRDLLQIADEHIKVRIPKTKGGKTQIEDYYPQNVVEAFGVTPAVFIDMKALMGDTSDNIRGVKGIGPKSAEKLLTTYGDLDGIYSHLDEMKPSAQKENLVRDRESAYLARKLVTICTEAPVDFEIDKAAIGNFYTPEAYVYFKKLGFKNFLNRFEDSAQETDKSAKLSFRIIDDLAGADEYLNGIAKKTAAHDATNPYVLAWHIPTPASPSADHAIHMISFADSEDEVVTIVRDGLITEDYLAGRLLELAGDPHIRFILYGAKNQYRYIDIPLVEDRCFDVLIAAYLIDPLRSSYDAEYIASAYNDTLIPGTEQLLGKNFDLNALCSENIGAVEEYSSYIAGTSYAAYKTLKDRLTETGMLSLFTDIEMPLSRVLASMEKNGIRVKAENLTAFSKELGESMAALEADIYEKAGEEFNILSPKQLGVILFEKLGLPGGKKTKTGYSTSADVLEKLKDVPLVADILEYRAVSKLKSTYADGLYPYIGEDGRIHSTFHQTITATGRISSADPNLQNIPTRTELGKGLRAAFIPCDGYIFADADYSQIELRILAHIAGDEQLLEAYRQGRDIHAITASKVFGVPLDEVTPSQRRNAKAVNFGIVYGISAFGLAQDLGISRKEAADYISQYFETFPGIKKYLDSSVEKAKQNGYAVTLYGRRRPVPELSGSDFMKKQFGERVAMNSPIQGTAADIMKIAMINVYRKLQELGLRSRIVLQIHDELLIETAPDEKDTVCELLEREMAGAADLSVKLEADLHTGSNWLDAK